MTVRDLIANLKGMDEDLPVGFIHHRQDGDTEFHEVWTLRVGERRDFEGYSGTVVLLNE